MRSNVTAILVAKHSGETLTETITAIRNQTVQPDRIIVIATGSTALAEELGHGGFDRVIATGSRTTFGAAVDLGANVVVPSDGDRPEWLWLLAEDTAPEEDALERMLTTVQSTGTAAVAGPKLVDWYDPRMILEMGQGLTWSGQRWLIEGQELDQQQYDHTEDVLGVGPVGMLVRHDVWRRLGGFDPALPVVDDGLDFSVRARLAGFRVIVVPGARIRTKRSGIAGPEVRRSRAVMRRTHRQARAAQLHRRVTYAPWPLAPILWLLLPLIGVLGMLWALIRERPGTMLGELRAALSVFVHPGRILRSRRTLRRHASAGWRAVRPLRADRKTVRSVRMVRREAILTALGRHRRDLHVISTGGLAVVIFGAVLAVATTWWTFGASFLTGGGFAPLSATVAELWSSTVAETSVNPASLSSFEQTAPVDPLTWVLAILGSVTFWNPSLALILLVVLAVPAAAFGGWMWASRLSESTSARVLAGVLWAVSPMLLGGIAQGRPNALVLAVALPWLLHALSLALRSWSWVGTASLLAAVVLAAAPILWPAAIAMLIIGAIAHPKRSGRMLAVAIAPVTLVLPRALHALAVGRPLDALADPGIPVPAQPATQWQMFLGFPTFGLDGWGHIFDRLGIETTIPVTLTVGLLLAPLALLALLGLYTGHPRFTVLTALAGGLGLLTALVSPKLLLAPLADALVPVWAGSGIALYWLAVITLAVAGVPILVKAAPAVTAVTIAGALLIVSPGIVNLVTGDVAITPDRPQVPAVVAAESNVNPLTRTLMISTLGQNELRAHILDGTGVFLDRVATRDTTAPATPGAELRARLVGALASTGHDRLGELLGDSHVTFVVLTSGVGGAADLLRSSLQSVFDQHPALTPVGDTQHGILWRVNEDAVHAPPAGTLPADIAADRNEGELGDADRPLTGRAIWGTQLAVLLAMLLLALPTGEVRELPDKRPRDRRRTVPVKPHSAVPVATEHGTGIPEPAGPTTEPTETTSEPDAIPTEAAAQAYEQPDDETLFVRPGAPEGGDDDTVWEAPDDDTVLARDPDTSEAAAEDAAHPRTEEGRP